MAAVKTLKMDNGKKKRKPSTKPKQLAKTSKKKKKNNAYMGEVALLTRLPENQRSSYCHKLSDGALNIICECCMNYINGYFGKKGVKKLVKYKAAIRKVADPKVSPTHKRRLIAQKGGFIAPLLTVLAPLAGSLFSKLFS